MRDGRRVDDYFVLLDVALQPGVQPLLVGRADGRSPCYTMPNKVVDIIVRILVRRSVRPYS